MAGPVPSDYATNMADTLGPKGSDRSLSRMPVRKWVIRTMAVTCLLTVAACGSTDDGADTAGPDPASPTTQNSAFDAGSADDDGGDEGAGQGTGPSDGTGSSDGQQQDGRSEEPGTELEALARELGIYVHDDNDQYYQDMEAAQALLAERNTSVSQCMADRDLEFVGDDPDVVHGFYDGFRLERNSPAWAARYGFGVTTLIWPQESLGNGAVGYPGRAPGKPQAFGDGQSDPLSAYLATLEDPDRYWTALFGANPDPATGEYAETSCAGVAARRSPDPTQSLVEALRVGVDERAALLDQLAGSDAVVETLSSGGRCLVERGYDFGDELEARISVWDRRGNLPMVDDPTAAGYLDALLEAQSYEVEVASAVWECGVAQAQLNRLKMSLLADLVADVTSESDG